jgi:hypothetical protein
MVNALEQKFLRIFMKIKHSLKNFTVYSYSEVYFCHQYQNAKDIGNFTTLLKPHNIGTHLKGWNMLSGGTIIFEILPLFGGYITFFNFLKIP